MSKILLSSLRRKCVYLFRLNRILYGASDLKNLKMHMYLRSDIHQFLALLKIDHHDGFLHISDIRGKKSISQNAFII